MAKRRLSFEEDYLKGYLYNVSKIEVSSSGKTRYFTGSFQSSKSEMQRLVAFTPEKHEQFVRAASIPMPVKLKNAKLSPGRNGTEIIVNRNTTLDVCQEPLSFIKESKNPSTSVEDTCSITRSIAEIDVENLKSTIDVTILGFLAPVRQVDTRYGTKFTREAVAADASKSIKITLWEKTIDAVQSGKSYRITNVVSKSYNNEIMLSTNSLSKIIPITDIPNVNEDLMAIFEDQSTEVTIEQTRVTQNLKCASCMKPVTLANKTDPTARCNHCDMKQKISSMRKATTAFINVNVCTTNEKKKFVIFEDILISFLRQNHLSSLIDDTDRLEDYLLMQGNIILKHAPNSDIVKKMSSQDKSAVSHQSESPLPCLSNSAMSCQNK